MKKSDIAKPFYKELKCKLYIIGGSTEGESVLFVVYGDDKVIYSCITDSFMQEKNNVPRLVAECCGLQGITDVFWTHPHDDHSDGIIELVETYKPESIYVPAELVELPEGSPKISKEVLETINQFPSCDYRFKYQPCVTPIATNSVVLYKMLNVSDHVVPFIINTVAPAGSKVRRDVVTDRYNQLNDFSIAVLISIGDFAILLTGDLQDQMIKYIKETMQIDIPTPNILKIPHHGSMGSTRVVSLFNNEEKVNLAVTTAKRSSHLPRTEALDTYLEYCEKLYKIGDEEKKIGIWEAEIDILEAQVIIRETVNYIQHSKKQKLG